MYRTFAFTHTHIHTHLILGGPVAVRKTLLYPEFPTPPAHMLAAGSPFVFPSSPFLCTACVCVCGIMCAYMNYSRSEIERCIDTMQVSMPKHTEDHTYKSHARHSVIPMGRLNYLSWTYHRVQTILNRRVLF